MLLHQWIFLSYQKFWQKDRLWHEFDQGGQACFAHFVAVECPPHYNSSACLETKTKTIHSFKRISSLVDVSIKSFRKKAFKLISLHHIRRGHLAPFKHSKACTRHRLGSIHSKHFKIHTSGTNFTVTKSKVRHLKTCAWLKTFSSVFSEHLKIHASGMNFMMTKSKVRHSKTFAWRKHPKNHTSNRSLVVTDLERTSRNGVKIYAEDLTPNLMPSNTKQKPNVVLKVKARNLTLSNFFRLFIPTYYVLPKQSLFYKTFFQLLWHRVIRPALSILSKLWLYFVKRSELFLKLNSKTLIVYKVTDCCDFVTFPCDLCAPELRHLKQLGKKSQQLHDTVVPRYPAERISKQPFLFFDFRCLDNRPSSISGNCIWICIEAVGTFD